MKTFYVHLIKQRKENPGNGMLKNLKHNLKAKHYMRYVDDFVILNRSKEKLLLYKWLINSFLKQRLKLELHPDKSKIVPLHNGVTLLGFRIFYHYKLPRKNNIRNFERKLNSFYTLTLRERERAY